MIYVMSDIHGCYAKYLKMLGLIKFSDEDNLYVLGDVIDRGDNPIEILKDMMGRANVYPIMGNHEEIALRFLPRLKEICTDENVMSIVDMFIDGLAIWLASDGGETTIEGFKKLLKEEQNDVLDYLFDFSLYEVVEVNGKTFVLTHQGVPEGATIEKLLGQNDYSPLDFISSSFDFENEYFKGETYLVIGHIPTIELGEKYKGMIVRHKNNIMIDSGAVFGGKLACLCLNNGKEYYV